MVGEDYLFAVTGNEWVYALRDERGGITGTGVIKINIGVCNETI